MACLIWLAKWLSLNKDIIGITTILSQIFEDDINLYSSTKNEVAVLIYYPFWQNHLSDLCLVVAAA